jgi:ribosome assembly protein 1
MVEKITKSLNLNLPPHVLRSRDPRAVLTALFAAWLPLSTALLVSVTEYLPSPTKAQAERMPELIDTSVGADHVAPEVRKAITESDKSEDAPVVAYVSKMFSVPESELPQHKRRGGALTAEEARDLGRKKRAELARQQAINSGEPDVADLTEALSSAAIGENEPNVPEAAPVEEEKAEHLIGFARIYSGTLSVGDEVYVLGPKFSPEYPHAEPEPKKVKITALYLMMGRGLEALESVPAGVVFGIGGLEGHMLKSGTICSQLPGSINLAGVTMGSEPIVRVALEPENPYDLDKMINGLKLLVQSDPCAEYEQLPSGEHVILTAGELHLERCLKDLEERFAKCKIQAGEPIVPYRESTVAAAEMNPPKDPELGRGVVVSATASKQVSVRLAVRPLPPSVTEFLSKNSGSIKRLNSERQARESGNVDAQARADVEQAAQDGMQEAEQRESGTTLTPAEFKTQLKAAFASAKKEKDIWTDDVIDKITAFAPRNRGPNVLIDSAGICSNVYVPPFPQPHLSQANTIDLQPQRHHRNRPSAPLHNPLLRLHHNLRLPTRHRPGPLLRRAHPRPRRLPALHPSRGKHRRRPPPPHGRGDKSRARGHPRGYAGLVPAHAARHVQLRDPSLHRRFRSRVRGPDASARTNPLRDDEFLRGEHDGEPNLHHLRPLAGCRVLRLQRRDPQTQFGLCESAA